MKNIRRATRKRHSSEEKMLNPSGDRKVERFGWTFAPGDKVMQIENDYDKEVYNGDIGYIDDVNSEEGELIARFDGRPVTADTRSVSRSANGSRSRSVGARPSVAWLGRCCVA